MQLSFKGYFIPSVWDNLIFMKTLMHCYREDKIPVLLQDRPRSSCGSGVEFSLVLGFNLLVHPDIDFVVQTHRFHLLSV